MAERLPQFIRESTILTDCRTLSDILSRVILGISRRLSLLEDVAPASVIVDTSTTPYTVTEKDYLVNADATAGAFSVVLQASPGTKREVSVCKVDASGNAVTVSGNGGTINGSATNVLGTQYLCRTYVYTGTEWRVKG